MSMGLSTGCRYDVYRVYAGLLLDFDRTSTGLPEDFLQDWCRTSIGLPHDIYRTPYTIVYRTYRTYTALSRGLQQGLYQTDLLQDILQALGKVWPRPNQLAGDRYYKVHQGTVNLTGPNCGLNQRTAAKNSKNRRHS